MGVGFTAVIDHALSWEELYQLPDALNAAWELPTILRPWVGEHVRAGANCWKWKMSRYHSSVPEELFNDGFVLLDGPSGFHGTVYKTGIEVMHLARWRSFLHEPEVQHGLQQAMRSLAEVVRASLIIYLPDNAFPPSTASEMLNEGATVDEAHAWLRSNVGPPVPDFETLRNIEEDASVDQVYLVEQIGAPG